jgi:hypothetical protein
MRRKLFEFTVIVVLVLGVGAAQAAAPAAVCEEKKIRGLGTYARDMLKAFGRNRKAPNASQLAREISRARSKITSTFTKAEFSSTGASRGCGTLEDVDEIQAKGDALFDDALDELAATTTTTTTTVVGTTTTTCPRWLSFTTGLPGGTCGRINDDPAGTGTDLTPYGATFPRLDCGTLYYGGGAGSMPPASLPDGATTLYAVSDCSVPTAMALAAASSTETGSNYNCSAPGCLFGPPLPIPNSGSPGASKCLINSIAAGPAVGGTLDAVAGAATLTLPLRVTVRVTGDLQPDPGIQPCPTCTGGTCDSGSNSGGACTTTSSLLTSHDCPVTFVTHSPFNVDMTPLTTGTSTRASGAGVFCAGPPVQRTAGCLGSGPGSCNYIEERGSPAGNLTVGPALPMTLASVFCFPKTNSVWVNSVLDLPGPGAVTLKGTANLVP